MKTKYLVKRNQYGAPVLLLAVIAVALAEFMAILSSYANATYAITSLESDMAMSEIALVFLILMAVLSVYLKGTASMVVMDVFRLIAVIMACACLYTVLDERATLMGYVWFSDLESGNANSVNALNYGVAAAALYAFSVIVCAISGAVEFVSFKKVKRTREDVLAEIEGLNKELAAMDK